MSDWNDRLDRDLRHIADKATPSSTAWEAIQNRIAEQADQPELEITMLKPNPNPEQPRRIRALAAAAAVVLVVVGLFAVFSGDSNETDTVDSPTVPTPTTAAPDTPAPPVGEEDAAAAAEADLAVVDEFLVARRAYDGDTMAALVSPDASLNGLDAVIATSDDYPLLAAYEQALGFATASEPECSVGDPGRVSCTYQAVSDQTEALGVGPYAGRFLIVVEDGLIVEVNSTITDEAAYGAEVYGPFQSWLVANHPEDAALLYDDANLPVVTAETIPLWGSYTEEFATSLAAADIAVVEAFIAARNDYDGATLVSLVHPEASLNGLDFIDTADEYPLLTDYEAALGLRVSEPECSVGDPGRVSCTYQAVSDQTEALGVGPYAGRFVITVEDGLIVEVNNTIADEAAYGAEVYGPFQSWLIANHPDDVPGLYDDTNLPVVTDETIPLWAAYTAEFAAAQ